ncbi:MAG: molybdenum cofactor biosynthesis protein MoaE [Planctomycetota bacterium]
MFKVTPEPLSLDAAWAAVRRPDCGAVAFFVGTVRDRHEGRRVERLSYTAFAEMAEKEFGRIAREARRRWTVGEVYVAHRTGLLEVGEASVLVAVSAPHRAEAFEACRFVIEELKKTAPIWKEEFYAGGGKAWVSSEGPEAP